MMPDLSDVATVYRQGMTPFPVTYTKLVAEPRKRVAEHYGVPESTANRWIRAARKAGHLGAATNGKAGES